MDAREKVRLRSKLRRKIKKNGKQCEICGSVVKLCLHHRDKNLNNNSDENLAIMCNRCHSRLHRLQYDIGIKTRLTKNILYIIKNSKLNSIALGKILKIDSGYIRKIRENKRNPRVFEDEANLSLNNEDIIQQICKISELPGIGTNQRDNI